MKLTVEHAIIGVLALALIYFVVQHRNLLTKTSTLLSDLFRIPDRDHPELKAVKDKHYLNCKIGWELPACQGIPHEVYPNLHMHDMPYNY